MKHQKTLEEGKVLTPNKTVNPNANAKPVKSSSASRFQFSDITNIVDQSVLRLLEKHIRFKLPEGGIHKPYIQKCARQCRFIYKILAPQKPAHPRKLGRAITDASNCGGSRMDFPKKSSTILYLEWQKRGSRVQPIKAHAQALTSFDFKESDRLLKL
jgi:hypothetical protein